jgi:hypothetical protein
VLKVVYLSTTSLILDYIVVMMIFGQLLNDNDWNKLQSAIYTANIVHMMIDCILKPAGFKVYLY